MYKHATYIVLRGVARYKMKFRHNLRRGVCGHLAPPTGPGQSPGGGSGGLSPQRKTILSVTE